jgi:hypothetical protein
MNQSINELYTVSPKTGKLIKRDSAEYTELMNNKEYKILLENPCIALDRFSKNSKVQNAVHGLANKVVGLTILYMNFKKGYPDPKNIDRDNIQPLDSEVADEVAKLLTTKGIRGFGTTYEDLIRAIKDDGNIRTYMTVIMLFGMNCCNVGWWLLIGYHEKNKYILQIIDMLYMSTSGIENRIKRIEELTGYSFDQIIQLFENPADTEHPLDSKDFLSFCHLFAYNHSGPVTISRELKPALRTWNADKNTNKVKKRIEDLTVPPSNIELDYWQEVYNDINSPNHGNVGVDKYGEIADITVSSGQTEWNTNPKNPLNGLADMSGHKIVAGPSGNTDLQLKISILFEGYEDYSKSFFVPFLAGILIWMSELPDHSIHEMLISATKFGYVYDTKFPIEFYLLAMHASIIEGVQVSQV